MKTIRVVAAVICDSIEHKTKIFSTARGYGEFKGGWEFPGGKIEAGETPQQAVVREIREELDATVRVGDLIDTIEYDYPAFHLSMDCFWCEVASGELKLLEAEAARWLTKEELDSVQWLPADVTLIDKIKRVWSRRIAIYRRLGERTRFATGVVFAYLESAVLTSTGNVSTIISKHIFLRFRQRELIHTSISFQ